jgi:heme iron utilization protein
MMNENVMALEQLYRLVTSQQFAVLSSAQANGHPYASLIAFIAKDGLSQMAFCTLRETRKYANLIAEPRIALLIDNRQNKASDLENASAVTILGYTEEMHGQERESWQSSFIKKHPLMIDFVKSSNCALMKVDVQKVFIVSHFHNVIEMHVQDGILKTVG